MRARVRSPIQTPLLARCVEERKLAAAAVFRRRQAPRLHAELRRGHDALLVVVDGRLVVKSQSILCLVMGEKKQSRTPSQAARGAMFLNFGAPRSSPRSFALVLFAADPARTPDSRCIGAVCRETMLPCWCGSFSVAQVPAAAAMECKQNQPLVVGAHVCGVLAAARGGTHLYGDARGVPKLMMVDD